MSEITCTKMKDSQILPGSETDPLLPHLCEQQQQQNEPQQQPGSDRQGTHIGRLFLVSLILFLHGCSSAIHSPVMSQYLYVRYGEVFFPNSSMPEKMSSHGECVPNTTSQESAQQKDVQRDSTILMMQLTLCTSIPAIITNMFAGAYSDYFGRRFLFIAMMIGRLTRDLTTVFVIYWHLDLNYFFIGYLGDGICGSTFSFYLAGYAYTADITPPAKVRTVALAIVDAARGIGEMSIHLATGYMIKSYGYFYPSIGMAAMTILDFLVVCFFLPETVRRRQGSCISPITAIKKVFRFYFQKSSTGNRTLFWICILVFLVKMLGEYGKSNIENLYMLSPPFCWNSVGLGMFWALRDGTYYLSSAVIIKVLHICTTDSFVAILGFISTAASFVLQALAYLDWMMYIVPVVGIMSSIISPALRAILSRMVAAEEQGAIFASMSVVEAACDAVGSSAFNIIYESTLTVMRGAVFLVMAATKLIAICLMMLTKIVARRSLWKRVPLDPFPMRSSRYDHRKSLSIHGYQQAKSGNTSNYTFSTSGRVMV